MIKFTQSICCDFCGEEKPTLISGIFEHGPAPMICSTCAGEAALTTAQGPQKHRMAQRYEAKQQAEKQAYANAQAQNAIGAAQGHYYNQANNICGGINAPGTSREDTI